MALAVAVVVALVTETAIKIKGMILRAVVKAGSGAGLKEVEKEVVALVRVTPLRASCHEVFRIRLNSYLKATVRTITKKETTTKVICTNMSMNMGMKTGMKIGMKRGTEAGMKMGMKTTSGTVSRSGSRRRSLKRQGPIAAAMR
jgi:hypothetical protein